jgi:hypothetical protein
MLLGGEECDELESEAGGCLTRFVWSQNEGAGSRCRLVLSFLFSWLDSSKAHLQGYYWHYSGRKLLRDFGQLLHCQVGLAGRLEDIAHSIRC